MNKLYIKKIFPRLAACSLLPPPLLASHGLALHTSLLHPLPLFHGVVLPIGAWRAATAGNAWVCAVGRLRSCPGNAEQTLLFDSWPLCIGVFVGCNIAVPTLLSSGVSFFLGRRCVQLTLF